MRDYSKILQSEEMRERFYSKFTPGAEDECWLWQGSIHCAHEPYGKIWFKNTSFVASRLAYVLHTGNVLPRHIFACHSCDNPTCVNPKHLFAGTAGDNNTDKKNKGRAARPDITECPKGHPYEGYNLLMLDGKRSCRICRNAIQRARYHRAKSEGKLSPSHMKRRKGREDNYQEHQSSMKLVVDIGG